MRFDSPVAVPSPSDVNNSLAPSEAITSDKSTVSCPLLASKPVPAMAVAKSAIDSLFRVRSASKKGIESVATAMAVSGTVIKSSIKLDPDNARPASDPEITR